MTWPNAAHTWKSTPLSFCFSLLGWCEEGETTQTMQNSPTICYTYFLRQRECIFARMLLTSPTLSQSSTTILRRPHLIKSISCPTSPSENLFTLKQIDFQKKGYMFLSFFFVLHSHITLLYQSWFNMRICFVDTYLFESKCVLSKCCKQRRKKNPFRISFGLFRLFWYRIFNGVFVIQLTW